MDSSLMTPLEKVKVSIENQNSFVLQGGAGSGKTETLKQIIGFIAERFPNKRLACITHTNLAADEIASRIEGDYSVSTIHSFLNKLIKNYKRNIHSVIYEIFKLDFIEKLNIEDFNWEDKELKKAEYDNYKKSYTKYSKQLFKLKKESIEKVVGKRNYDKDSLSYNDELNKKSQEINLIIKDHIEGFDYNKVLYNETKFDSLKDLSFGHDSLIKITALLFDRYPLISRILQDKYDYIFIDEFQDTNPDIIDIVLNKLNGSTTIGLFGDSMQGIYEDGVGDVEHYISIGKVRKITKLDNYRCSKQIIDFLNHLRTPIDCLEQEIAFKKVGDKVENLEQRQGVVKVFYAIYPREKPHTFSKYDEKKEYLHTLMRLIETIELDNHNYKKLMLTNKSISEKVGFSNVFDIFSERYSEVSDEIEKCFEKLSLLELANLCICYKSAKYNDVISSLKKSGFSINTIGDKLSIKDKFNSLIDNELSALEAINFAIDEKLVSCTDSYQCYLQKKDNFLSELEIDQEFQDFKPRYLNGGNTFVRFEKLNLDYFGGELEYTGREERYSMLERLLKKQKFYQELFSNKISFEEIIQYCKYLNENTDYITMHKTKGSGIDNVLVVIDDFFWSKYQFKTLFEKHCENEDMKLKVQKLFYVACSRAKKNLICLRLIEQEEESDFIKSFPSHALIEKIPS